jgi:hypothetical protein
LAAKDRDLKSFEETMRQLGGKIEVTATELAQTQADLEQEIITSNTLINDKFKLERESKALK